MLSLCATAQSVVSAPADKNILNHLDLGVEAGSTGLGLSLALPVGDMVRVRTGFGYMPHTNVPMTFDLMTDHGINDEDNKKENERFDKLAQLLSSFTGGHVDKVVNMNAKGKMLDFRLLVDVFPLKNNKHFYATAGFYWGASNVGHIENTINEAPSLMAVMMYNKMYDFFVNYKYLDEPIYGDIFLDPMKGDEMREQLMPYFNSIGRVGAYLGRFKEGAPAQAGTPYLLVPDVNGTIHADMYVNHFKPYLGVGYTTTLSSDGRWNLGVDAGALFWGKPRILTHEQYIYAPDGQVSWGIISPNDTDSKYDGHVNMATDLDGIPGKVGTYARLAKAMHVYPSLNIRISYKLF